MILSHFETLDKWHGRIETRRCIALAVPDYLPEMARCSKIKSIARIESTCETGDKKSTEIRYLIGSVEPHAQLILNATRLHWVDCWASKRKEGFDAPALLHMLIRRL